MLYIYFQSPRGVYSVSPLGIAGGRSSAAEEEGMEQTCIDEGACGV